MLRGKHVGRSKGTDPVLTFNPAQYTPPGVNPTTGVLLVTTSLPLGGDFDLRALKETLSAPSASSVMVLAQPMQITLLPVKRVDWIRSTISKVLATAVTPTRLSLLGMRNGKRQLPEVLGHVHSEGETRLDPAVSRDRVQGDEFRAEDITGNDKAPRQHSTEEDQSTEYRPRSGHDRTLRDGKP